MPVTLLRQPLLNERTETAPLVMSFLRHFSMEITQPSDAELAELKSVLPARSPVYVPAIPKSPPSELIRPPSNPAVIFLRPTDGSENGSKLSLIMAGVAASDSARG